MVRVRVARGVGGGGVKPTDILKIAVPNITVTASRAQSHAQRNAVIQYDALGKFNTVVFFAMLCAVMPM